RRRAPAARSPPSRRRGGGAGARRTRVAAAGPPHARQRGAAGGEPAERRRGAMFVWCPEEDGAHAPGRAAQVWLREALRSLGAGLAALGSPLVLRRARCYAEALLEVAREVGACSVHFARRYEPLCRQADERTAERLRAEGVEAHGHAGYLLYEPAAIDVRRGYTSGHWGTLMPFCNACRALGEPRRPLPAPQRLRAPAARPGSEALEALGLEAGVAPGGQDWGASLRAAWPGISEGCALACMQEYVQRQDGLQAYEQQRSRADLEANPNSKLSAFLRWGQLSPHDLFWAVRDAGLPREQTKTFGRRLFWRDLAYFQMHHFPEMQRKGIRAHYDATQWRDPGDGMLRCWQRGRTGYPLVDASMRELRATGWVQQNMRMVAASFLTEFLNISWVEGARWYEDQLVDSDVAINSMMWQNAGRSGADQWNFRTSPVSAKSQDPSGAYVRRWLPELARLPTRFLHKPWEAPPDVLAHAGVQLGASYPERCIADLAAAREEAKEATLAARRSVAATWMNDAEGYDVVALPDGTATKLFTRRELRLTSDGRPLTPAARPPPQPGRAGRASGSGRARSGGGRHPKQRRRRPEE
ncbi:unnamed protein product, partial [Prorocentrum cordatum]